MVNMKYTAPVVNLSAFHCPNCGAYSAQVWQDVFWTSLEQSWGPVPDWRVATCHHCKQSSFWRDGRMVYPSGGNAPLPNADLPPDIKRDYDEARDIANLSPRGAAALLRLCIQKLCKHLHEKGENPNDDIASLVKKGLPIAVQKALDTVTA